MDKSIMEIKNSNNVMEIFRFMTSIEFEQPIAQFQAILCMCTHQYLEFGDKLLGSLLYPSNVMFYIHCMIVLAILSWTNDQYEAKICTLHSFR